MINILNYIKLYSFPIICTVCFGAGVYTSHVFHGYEESKHLQDIQDQVVKQQAYNNSVIKASQTSSDAYEAKANTIKGELDAVKLTNVPCLLSNHAVFLWNQSSSFKTSLPTDTTGVVEDTSTPATVTIDEALSNKIDEDKEYNEARDRIIKLNEWNNHTYGTE